MTLDKNKAPNMKYASLESFFPLVSTTDSGLQERNNQSKQKNKSTKEGTTIKKTILIQRRSSNSDIWVCNSCTLTGDRWFMEKHPCKQNVTNNFAKVVQRFQEHFWETNNMTFTNNSSSNEIQVNPEYYKLVNPLYQLELKYVINCTSC